MSVTKEYYDELYNTMVYLAGRYAPDIEILVNTINSGNRNRGVFSIKSYWFDPKANNRLRFVDYFCENTGLAAQDAANYFFKLFCARLIVMAFYTIYLKEIFKRVDSIKKHMFANIKFGWGAKDTL